MGMGRRGRDTAQSEPAPQEQTHKSGQYHHHGGTHPQGTRSQSPTWGSSAGATLQRDEPPLPMPLSLETGKAPSWSA